MKRFLVAGQVKPGRGVRGGGGEGHTGTGQDLLDQKVLRHGRVSFDTVPRLREVLPTRCEPFRDQTWIITG